MFDASDLAKAVLGDSIYSNMMVFGAAWQMGAIPVTFASISKAIELNGAAVERNKRAFDLGRWAVLNPEKAAQLEKADVVEMPKTLDAKIAFREAHLVKYQGARLAKRYRKLVDQFAEPQMKEAVAEGYHKVLAYKDEYEVARLLLETKSKAQETFDGDLKVTYHLAPPMVTKVGSDGRPMKKAYGDKMARAFPVLARMKRLRGTPLDPFGYTAERRMERALIKEYEGDMKTLIKAEHLDNDAAIALARLPLSIRGFGPVKDANAREAAKQREALLAKLKASPIKHAAE
jgi:indolepyruvate ferredoxin oxidoreductase